MRPGKRRASQTRHTRVPGLPCGGRVPLKKHALPLVAAGPGYGDCYGGRL
jgi:hypothetical protein